MINVADLRWKEGSRVPELSFCSDNNLVRFVISAEMPEQDSPDHNLIPMRYTAR